VLLERFALRVPNGVAKRGQLLHYQDYNNTEIDAVVQLPDGRWGAFEI
jgi:hypothetical protein